jgi:enterochelin esterase-like enzyme
MRRRSVLNLVLITGIAVLAAGWGGSSQMTSAVGAARAAASPAQSPQIIDGAFYSKALQGTDHYSIALPPGYATSGLRYPVVYFLHGLPAPATGYKDIAGLANSLAQTQHPAIVVGAEGTRAGDIDPEWHDWGPGRNWETATESELVKWVDSHYRTLARRSGRALVGESAGGYGATLIAIHHPETYQVMESWSGYFEATDVNGKPLTFSTPNATINANAHFSVPYLKNQFAPYQPTYFGFYIGNKDPYPGFVADNERLYHELKRGGAKHLFFAIYPGSHNFAFWAQHRNQWLSGAVKRLDPPSSS